MIYNITSSSLLHRKYLLLLCCLLKVSQYRLALIDTASFHIVKGISRHIHNKTRTCASSSSQLSLRRNAAQDVCTGIRPRRSQALYLLTNAGTRRLQSNSDGGTVPSSHTANQDICNAPHVFRPRSATTTTVQEIQHSHSCACPWFPSPPTAIDPVNGRRCCLPS